jgi:TolA-binding protein
MNALRQHGINAHACCLLRSLHV